jgi:hypothetical protein
MWTDADVWSPATPIHFADGRNWRLVLLKLALMRSSMARLCVLDRMAVPILTKLLYRRGTPVFYAFDVLALDGRDLRQLPMTERKRRLIPL